MSTNGINKPGSNNVGMNTGTVFGSVDKIDLASSAPVEVNGNTNVGSMHVGDTINLTINLPDSEAAATAAVNQIMDRLERMVENSKNSNLEFIINNKTLKVSEISSSRIAQE